MRYEITPFKQIGPLKIGMSSSDVRSALGGSPVLVPNKTEYSEYPTEHYENKEAFVFYDAQGKAEAFELTGDQGVYFEGRDLFTLPTEEAISFLMAHDPDPRKNDAGMDFTKIGIGIYIPLGEKIEAILAFKEGYFDDPN